MLFHTQLHRKLNEIICFVCSLCVSVNHRRVFSKVWVDTVRSSWDIGMVPHSADGAVHNGTTVCPHLMMFMLSLSVSSYFIFFPSFCLWGCKCHSKFLLFKKKKKRKQKRKKRTWPCWIFAIWLRYLLLLSPHVMKNGQHSKFDFWLKLGVICKWIVMVVQFENHKK